MSITEALKKIKKITSFKSDLGFANLTHGEAVDLIEYVNKIATESLKGGSK